MSQEVHEKLKAEIARLDSVILENENLKEKNDELTKQLQQHHYTSLMIRDSYVGKIDSLERQIGFMMGVISKKELEITKLYSDLLKHEKMFVTSRDQNSELIYQNARLKEQRRKEYLSLRKEKKLWLIAVSGWLLAGVLMFSRN